jgi:hypothetical protein
VPSSTSTWACRTASARSTPRQRPQRAPGNLAHALPQIHRHRELPAAVQAVGRVVQFQQPGHRPAQRRRAVQPAAHEPGRASRFAVQGPRCPATAAATGATTCAGRAR